MSGPMPRLWTLAEFLDWEACEPERYEYLDGVIRMMTGGTVDHATIRLNVAAGLLPGVRARRCRIFDEGPKVVGNSFSMYPDVMVTCKSPDPKAAFVTEPVIIVEVLSRSTESYDRGSKWRAYQSIATLVHGVFISQDEVKVQVYTREGALWRFEVFDDLALDLVLPAIGCSLSLADIYRETSLDPAALR
jgi:Uma2 family endonuclease